MKTKKIASLLLAAVLLAASVLAFPACSGNPNDPGTKTEKDISIVAREQGSGTREAFDTVVTDGTRFLQEKDANGKSHYYTTKTAAELSSTGAVLSAVAADKNAIGYISLGSVNDTIRVLQVGGVLPSKETVLSGAYKIQRPFVVMTKKDQTLTPLTADFLAYLESNEAEAHCESAGTILLTDPAKRANEGETGIAVSSYTKQATLPAGDKIVVRGSTSMDKLIHAAAKGYATLYGVSADRIFDIQLEGSSYGRKAVEQDTIGNTIGLSSAAVKQSNIRSFNICLDAVAVIVNRENTTVSNLTLAQLYDIFTGNIKKFSEIG